MFKRKKQRPDLVKELQADLRTTLFCLDEANRTISLLREQLRVYRKEASNSV